MSGWDGYFLEGKMMIKNTNNQYGSVSIFFHWLMAILIIIMLCIGFYAANFTTGDLKKTLFFYHKATGILILGLAVLRLGWRFVNILPSLHFLPRWERVIAYYVQWLFYGFMFFLPLSGWLMSSAANKPISFFGLFFVPLLVAPNRPLASVFAESHEYLAYALIFFLALHTAAALKHHFFDKNNILKRIL